MILALRTDKPVAELYLLSPDGQLIGEHSWQAHRELADTILPTIEDFLKHQQLSIKDLTGLVIFTGQGSFTGLRIGTTVANALAFSLDIPIVKASGDEWRSSGLAALQTARPQQFVIPDYDGEPNITQPKPKTLHKPNRLD